MHDPSAEVLAAFGVACPPAGVRALGAAGGFSGARFWRIADRSGTLCLRRWPVEHPSSERLEFIHAVLRHVAQGGVRLVPVPRPTLNGTTFVRHDGHLWELTPWMPGEADFQRSPRPQKLAAALLALAHFHAAAADFPGLPATAVSPGMARRVELLDRWLAGGVDRLAEAITPALWPELYGRAGRIVMGFRFLAESIRPALARAATRPTALQPCIRDIWHDHVLFQGDAVTGLVDFGAVDRDSVACDVGRLLGSLAGDDPDLWRVGLESYQQIRPLGGGELEMVGCFDRSTVLMAGLNWLQWIYVDKRRFDDPRAVLRRIDEILLRLDRALGPVEGQGGRPQEKSR
jgi:homoserine kinase type II